MPLRSILAPLLIFLLLPPQSHAQSYGPGDSPGRAAYRPSSQWNDGPFYTTPHWNPYAPHRASSTDLFASMPGNPPYSTAPRGLYANTNPNAPLYRYSEGFSPYSGYSSWYKKSYSVDPTRDRVIQARTQFFRSAPRPPANVLPPLPPAQPRAAAPTARASAPPIRTRLVLPNRPQRGAIIYRSNISGF